jgi:glycosyltransferase involved in cell wall biosynthesis
MPDVHLAVAGDTTNSPAPALAQRLGVAERVHFLGKVSQVPSLMRSVDLFVFPSRYEAHPLVILEAMASGLPVIVSKNVGSAGTFGDALEVLDKPDDAECLARLMEDLLQSPERRSGMSQKARARALELSWDKTTAAYLSIYRNLTEQKKKHSAPGQRLTVGAGE